MSSRLPQIPAEGEPVYTVSQLNREVRLLLERRFPALWVAGEISNLARPDSGHIYFSLKDANAQVRCAMFRNANRTLKFRAENGQQVLMRARVGLFDARGEYQLIVEHMEPAGDGLLLRKLEELKARLAAEGLFDPALKKRLPGLPRRIGLITSPTGAALRDILQILRRRFPVIPIVIYPVQVQGEQAKSDIAAADWIPDHELAVLGGLALDPITRGPRVDTCLRCTRAGVFAAGNLVQGAEPADVAALSGRHAARAAAGWLAGPRAWPAGSVPIVTRAPLGWISPNSLGAGAEAPPRGHFALRASAFVRRPTIEVTQGGRLLWRERVRRLQPGRSAAVSAGWVAAADPAGEPVEVTLAGR